MWQFLNQYGLFLLMIVLMFFMHRRGGGGCCGGHQHGQQGEHGQHGHQDRHGTQDGIELKIEGMTCGHCKGAVEKALLKVPGVTQAEVDLARKQAVVIGNADRSELVKAVTESGYKVINNP